MLGCAERIRLLQLWHSLLGLYGVAPPLRSRHMNQHKVHLTTQHLCISAQLMCYSPSFDHHLICNGCQDQMYSNISQCSLPPAIRITVTVQVYNHVKQAIFGDKGDVCALKRMTLATFPSNLLIRLVKNHNIHFFLFCLVFWVSIVCVQENKIITPGETLPLWLFYFI